MDNRILIGAISAVVVVVMLGGVLMPVIDDATTGKSESNPDAGWIRMNYDTAAGSTYTVTITPGDDGITVANGSDTQTGSDDTIFYADSNVAVWMQDGTVNILGQNTDGPQFLQPEEAITVTRTAEGVTVASGGDSLSFAAPAWAYVPFSSGSYGYFTDGTAVKTNSPMAAVGGGFAGVYAYNDITRYAGLGLQLQTVMEDGKLTGAYWAKPAAADSLSITPLDPGSITIQPLDPSILDPEPGASIMTAPPTPTYTDGYWGFDLADGTATIVSYSGPVTNIVMPSSVTTDGVTYAVKAVGKGVNNAPVFDTTAFTTGTNCTLTLPDGIETINDYAFKSDKFIGNLIIPDSVTYIGVDAFGYTAFTGNLIIPNSVTTLGTFAFESCQGFNGTLTLPNNISVIPHGCFMDCRNFTGALTIPDSVTEVKNVAFSGCWNFNSLIIPDSVTIIGEGSFKNLLDITSLDFPKNVTMFKQGVFEGCRNITGDLIVPTWVTSVGREAFSGCYGYNGVLVVPDSVTELGIRSFYGTKVTQAIIASSATPALNTFGITTLTEVLDLSDSTDYSADRYGIPDSATVQDNIGDSAGYITFVEIGGDAPLNEGAKQILMAVPVLVIFSLIVAALVIFLKRSY